MKYLCAAFILAMIACPGEASSANENCTHTWGKGNFKTFKQVQEELQDLVGNARILRFSLCGDANDRYFQVTVLDPSGKVRVVRLAAR